MSRWERPPSPTGALFLSEKAFSRLGSEPGEKPRRTARKGLARRYHHPCLPTGQQCLTSQHRQTATATVQPMRLRNRRAERQQPPQHGSTSGRVRRAHQVKSSDAVLFPDVPGRHKPRMVVGFACDGVEKHGAHGAPYARAIHPADFWAPKSTAPRSCVGAKNLFAPTRDGLNFSACISNCPNRCHLLNVPSQLG